ncbi:MAG: sensor histidine kinase, partial [Geminicoccales bacterium]
TPLAIIDGTIRRLVRKPDKVTAERIGEMGKKIRGSVARLIGLIESVLDAAHLEEGRIKYQPDACAIRDILSELRNTYQEAYPEHRIDLDADDLPAQITADERLLRQIFSNLLSNAVKYSPDGSVVDIRGRCADDGTFRVDVQDNGVGIPEAERSRLFERFFRASTSTGITGTGIGLHLTQHFVQLHQGAIDMESVEGEGSTFTVRLPIHTPNEPIRSDDVAT